MNGLRSPWASGQPSDLYTMQFVCASENFAFTEEVGLGGGGVNGVIEML